MRKSIIFSELSVRCPKCKQSIIDNQICLIVQIGESESLIAHSKRESCCGKGNLPITFADAAQARQFASTLIAAIKSGKFSLEAINLSEFNYLPSINQSPTS